jgi:hypothetical protein
MVAAHHRAVRKRNVALGADVVPSKELHRGVLMEDIEKFRKYAEECRRFAKSMKSRHKATLLEIAEAWDQCADEAERERPKNGHSGRKERSSV